MTENEIEWIGQAEVARICGRAVRTVEFWRWQKAGPPYYRVCGAVRYNKAEVIAFREAARIEPSRRLKHVA